VVEATSLELPRDSQKAEVGTPVVHTPTVDSAIVDDVAIAMKSKVIYQPENLMSN
jgi:hypothetical protein